MNKKNWVLGRIACFTACKKVLVLGLTASSWKIAAPKHFIKSMMDSDVEKASDVLFSPY